MRKFKQVPPKVLEKVIKKSLKIINAELNDDQIKLLLRLIISGIAYHYFLSPDDIIDVGFLRFEKSPDKNELFKVTLLRNEESGVINAETLWEFYNGDMARKKQLKKVMNEFLGELINYSKNQEMNIMNLTSNVNIERKGENNHGV